MELLTTFNNNLPAILKAYEPDNYSIIANRYIILEYNNDIPFLDIPESNYPRLYAEAGMEYYVSEFDKVRLLTGSEIYGYNVNIAIIDGGVNPDCQSLRRANGVSKIKSYLDQETSTIYTNEMFNYKEIYEPLLSDEDKLTHGTLMAEIIAGENGLAPDCELIVVGLSDAGLEQKNHYNVPDDVRCFSEADIMRAVEFCINESQDKPLVILVPLQTNLGCHEGRGCLESYISLLTAQPLCMAVVCAGNEAVNRNHTEGVINKAGEGEAEHNISIVVSESGTNTFINCVYDKGAVPYLNITGPAGESFFVQNTTEKYFRYDNSRLEIKYEFFDTIAEKACVYIRAANLSQGIWQIYTGVIDSSRNYGYQAFLPIKSMQEGNVDFLYSSPENTVTSPGDASGALTLGAYNDITGAMYFGSGRGGILIKPEVIASESYTDTGCMGTYKMSDNMFSDITADNNMIQKLNTVIGTSVAAAYAAGIAVNVMGYIYYEMNQKDITGTEIKLLFMSSAVPKSKEIPSNISGYGMISIENIFRALR